MSLDFAITSWKVRDEKTAWSLILDPVDLDEAVPAVDDLERRDHALLKARGGGDDLEDAAGLIGIGHRAVHPVPLGETPRSDSD